MTFDTPTVFVATALTNDATLQFNATRPASSIIPAQHNIEGNYIQGAGGNLIIGVSTTSITEFNIVGAATLLGGTVTFAYAPGSYSAFTRPFLFTTEGLTGNFTTVAADVSHPVPSNFLSRA